MKIVSKISFFYSILSFFVADAPVAQNTNWQWNGLAGVPQASYMQAMQQNQGIVGMDALFPEVSKIGMGTVSVETIRSRPTHFPIDGYRRAHTGLMSIFYRGSLGFMDDDDDMIMYFHPNPGDKWYESYIATGKTSKRKIEGEIDIKGAFATEIMNNGPRLFTQVTGYGPWIHEKHDYFDTRPHDYLEIHPCENIWWSQLLNNKLKYTIGVFSDNSGRFNKWRPNPVIALNAIAFEFTSGERPFHFDINILTSQSMVPYPLYNDNATNHVLLDGNDTIITVAEPVSPNVYYSIDFASVSKTPIGNGKYSYKGLLKIHTAVRDGGHCIFTVNEINRPIITQKWSEVTVTLQSIRCIAVDDGNDTEELYGVYGVSAVTGQAPFHLNLFTTGTTNGILWQRKDGNTLNLKKSQTSMINGKRIYTIPASGELVLYGDIDEDDGDGNDDDDKLGDIYLERINVSDIIPGKPKIITHLYKSGGTVVEAKISIERKDPVIKTGPLKTTVPIKKSKAL